MTYTNLASLAQTLWNVLGLLNRRANQLLKQRNLDRLRESMREGEFCPASSMFSLHLTFGLAFALGAGCRRAEQPFGD